MQKKARKQEHLAVGATEGILLSLGFSILPLIRGLSGVLSFFPPGHPSVLFCFSFFSRVLLQFWANLTGTDSCCLQLNVVMGCYVNSDRTVCDRRSLKCHCTWPHFMKNSLCYGQLEVVTISIKQTFVEVACRLLVSLGYLWRTNNESLKITVPDRHTRITSFVSV